MKQVQNLIVFFLCFIVVGFFANFAQNDYGMTIVTYSCLFISILFLLKQFILVLEYKYLIVLFVIAFASIFLTLSNNYLTMVSENKGVINDNNSLALFMITFSSILLILLVLIPLLGFFQSKKRGKKLITINYFENLFSALFCMGIFMKNAEKPAASAVLVLSGLLIIPYLGLFVTSIVKSISSKNLSFANNGLACLFIGLIFVSFIFKTQHWPMSAILLNAAFIDFGILLVGLCVMHFKFLSFNQWWQQQNFTKKTMLVCFFVTTTYTFLMWNKFIPELYSNRFPKAYQVLKMNANDYTDEGKLNAKRTKVYLNNYEAFFMNNSSN